VLTLACAECGRRSGDGCRLAAGARRGCSGGANEIQGILTRSVQMKKILNEMQNILHLRRPNAKDFDRACRNAPLSH
jgi:hypothetical protein